MKKYSPLTNLSKPVQIGVTVSLATLVFIFLIAYWFNVAGLLRVLKYNNNLNKEALSSKLLKEVDSFNQIGTDSYSVTVKGDSTCNEEVKFDEQIYTVKIINPDWYVIETLYGRRIYQPTTDLFETEVSGGAILVKHKKGQAIYNSGDDVCSVFLNKDGSYRVEFINSDIPDYTLHMLTGVSVLKKLDDGYMFAISSSYNKELADVQLNYATDLPTSNIYYNEGNLTFVKNIPSNFTWSFIIQSHIVFILLVWFVYAMYLVRLDCDKSDFILNTDGVSILNLSLLLGLLISVVVPFILFKGGR